MSKKYDELGTEAQDHVDNLFTSLNGRVDKNRIIEGVDYAVNNASADDLAAEGKPSLEDALAKADENLDFILNFASAIDPTVDGDTDALINKLVAEIEQDADREESDEAMKTAAE